MSIEKTTKGYVESEKGQIVFSLDEKQLSGEIGESLDQLLGSEFKQSSNPIMLVKVNHKIYDLNYCPKQDDKIETLPLSSSDGWRTYQRGLIFLFIQAAKETLQADVRILHSLGSGIYVEIINRDISPFDVDHIGRKMREYVEQDQPFVLEEIKKNVAIELYRREGQIDKARLLAYRESDTFKTYSAFGKTDYYYGFMPASSGYLQKFRLEYELPGIVILQPKMNEPEAPITYQSSHKLMHVFRQSEKWADMVACNTVADLNDMVMEGTLEEFVLVNEARHDKEIAEFAHQICMQEKRLVLVAGPSSSGKTTFTQKLRLQLRANGKHPLMISLDNYYEERDILPKNEDGSIDLEHINTLRLELFNQHLSDLLNGKRVEIPRFDFQSGKPVDQSGNILQLEKDDLLLIEGIHGLNDSLTESISRKEKFKIYISALTQLNLDRHNRIQTTDVRLIRRMVRDFKHRNASAQDTLAMWDSVRAGEDRWIFPFQEHCDVMFNSTLMYELLFLKQYAKPLLQSVSEDNDYYSEANRLNKFLNYFIDPGDESGIPNTSLLREFIGGGVFEQ